MSKSSAVTSGSAVLAAHKVHTLLNRVSYAAGDLTLVEHSFLLGASRNEHGTSMKELTQEYSFVVGDPTFLAKNLIEQELAILVRNSADRRGLALKVTAKGITRLTLIDETMTMALIDANALVTQESIEYLAECCQHISTPSEAATHVETLLPAEFVLLVCRYRSALVRSSASVGLSTLQAIILLFLDASSRAVSSETLRHALDIPEAVVLRHIEYLEERNLLEATGDDAFILGEEGILRIDEFMQRSASALECLIQHRSGEELNRFYELCEYCEYVFR